MSWGPVGIALDNASSELTHTNEHSSGRGSGPGQGTVRGAHSAASGSQRPSFRAQKAQEGL